MDLAALFLGMGLILFSATPHNCRSLQSSAAATPTANQEKIAQLKISAEQARAANRPKDAIENYRLALEIDPGWVEGWWLMSTLLYDQDLYAEAAKGFERAAKLEPRPGAPWAMLGLCEYELGQYDEALSHIQQAHALGITNNPALSRVMRYHEGILLTFKGEFETAQQTLMTLSNDDMNSENLIIAHGLAALRMPVLPKDVKPGRDTQRDLIRRVGWAEHLLAQRNMGDAKQAYERLVADYPKTPNIQYIYGRYQLMQRDDERAVAAFKKEIENSPDHAMARFQIAYIKLNHHEAKAGLPFAEEGVRLHSQQPMGHYIYGRLLFDTDQNEHAIRELEVARHLAPNDSKIHYALFRAYKRANREADAKRAEEEFVRLKQISEGGMEFGPGESEASPPSENTEPQ